MQVQVGHAQTHGLRLPYRPPTDPFGAVPPAVFETPAWSLRGERRDGRLVLSNGPRRSEAMPLDQPVGIVRHLERQQRLAELLDGREEPHPEQVLLQRADKALGAAIALRRPDKGRRALDPEKAQFSLDGVGHVLRAMIMAD